VSVAKQHRRFLSFVCVCVVLVTWEQSGAMEPEAVAVSAAVARVRARAKRLGIGQPIIVSELPSRFPDALYEHKPQQPQPQPQPAAAAESEADAELFDLTPLQAVTFAQYVDQQITRHVAETAAESPAAIINRLWRVAEIREQRRARLTASASATGATDDANAELYAPLPPPMLTHEEDLPEVVARRALHQHQQAVPEEEQQQQPFPELKSLAFARSLRARVRQLEDEAKAKARAKATTATPATASAPGAASTTATAAAATTTTIARTRRRGYTTKPVAKHRMRVELDGTVFRLRKTPTYADIALESPSKSVVSPKFIRQPSLALQEANAAVTAATATATATADPSTAIVPVSPDEIVLRISFFSKKGAHDQDWLVLGSQKLTELRDEFSCLRDELARSQAVMAQQRVLKSASFLIENVFYNDMRCPENADLSAPIVAWADRKRAEMPATSMASASILGPYERKDMAATTFAQLRVRVGASYAFLHQGDCEHRVVVTDIRLFSPGEDEADRRKYPRLVCQSRVSRRKCAICNLFAATLVTYGDERAPSSPAFWCQRCYDGFHLDAAGNPLYTNFTKLPYIHELK